MILRKLVNVSSYLDTYFAIRVSTTEPLFIHHHLYEGEQQ
nr:MAG TPA: Polyphosphate kinase N-terminal domain [Caudoviricetes sp.]